MKDNAFTGYFILILLLLCVVVTPFASCQKDLLPRDGSQPGDSLSTEDTTPGPETTPTPDEVEPPVTKEYLLENGVLYTGELNGTHVCELPRDKDTITYSVTVWEDKISVESTIVGEEALGEYTGSLEYAPSTGELRVHLSFRYYEGKGTTVYRSPYLVRGKLYEYNSQVYFLCEASDIKTFPAEDEQMLSFPAQHENPGTLSVAEWAEAGFGRYESSSRVFYAIRALLRSDAAEFARRCSVSAPVYESLRSVKFDEYRFYREEIPAEDNTENTRAYAVLEVEVLESESDILEVGTHRLVFEEGLCITFTPREEFKRYSTYREHEISQAVQYVTRVGAEDFSPILREGQRQGGLSEFIVGRLNDLAGDTNPRTAEEIRHYAETYLSVDGDTLRIDHSLDKVEGGYIIIGRGRSSYERTIVSEEIRDGITVVTVQFWADFSRTVPSRLVEFHLELMGEEYRPVKTVILSDSGFPTASAGT